MASVAFLVRTFYKAGMHRAHGLFVLTLLLASTSLAQKVVPGNPTKASATDTPTTAAGASLIVPAGWLATPISGTLSVQSPEADTHIVFLEEKADDAVTAVAQAWSAYKPGLRIPLKNTYPKPDKEGWRDTRVFNYETSPNERAVVVAIAQRAAGTWTVVLLDGKEPTFEKREAQISLMLRSLRPNGYEREMFTGRKVNALTPERIEELRNFVEVSMKKLNIPGVGLALIDGGKAVYEGGVGVKAMNKPEPVDANTLFMAASNTKGMTTLLLAKLVDAKKLAWNQPVTQVYPSFALGDPAVTRSVEVRHLVCACTGLPRQDYELLFEYRKFTPQSTFSLLSGMKPTSKFGEVFQYSNLMASAAGYIAASLLVPSSDLGKAYDLAMQKEIFDPLHMASTTFDMARAQSGNFAMPHSTDLDGHTVVLSMDENYALVPFRPAGGVWSSAHDMSRYAMLELSRGKLPDGTQFVSEENLLARRQPQITTGEDQSYGMGLEVDRHWGVPIVHHGGSMFGYKSDWMILPDSGSGAVLLTNADAGEVLLEPFLRKFVEVLFNGRPEAVSEVDAAAANIETETAKERAKLAFPADATEVGKLAAHYSNSALGAISVQQLGGHTLFALDALTSRVASRKNDDGTVSFIFADPPLKGVEFVRSNREEKEALVVRDGQHEYVFLETFTP